MELREMRKLLKGHTWADFYNSNSDQPKILKVKDVSFIGVFGIYLGRPVVAILVDKQFVAIRPLRLPPANEAAVFRNHRDWVLPDHSQSICNILNYAKSCGDKLGLIIEPDGAENEPLAIEPALA